MFGALGTARYGRLFAVEAHAGARSGQVVLRVRGELWLDTVPEFLKAVRKEQAPAVIFDFSDVTSLDSSGVGALIQIYTSFRQARRKLAFTGFGPRVQAVLEVTRVLKLFPVHATLTEAEAQLS